MQVTSAGSSVPAPQPTDASVTPLDLNELGGPDRETRGEDVDEPDSTGGDGSNNARAVEPAKAAPSPIPVSPQPAAETAEAPPDSSEASE